MDAVNILADSLSGNLIINVYSIILLIVIVIHVKKLNLMEFIQDRLFIMILYCTVLLLFLDILSRFDGRPNTIFPVINTLGNFLIFLFNPVLPSLWILYVHFQVFRKESKTKQLYPILFSINIVYDILLTLSQTYGWFYYIDQENIYHRGPFYWVPVVFVLGLIAVSVVISTNYRKKLERKYFLTLIFFVIPPVVATFIQVLFYGLSLVLNGVTLSILVLFINIQNSSIYTDYLTGVNNRKKLDAYLKGKINSGEKAFSAVLVDINNFKAINDTYGHDTGDAALETAANMLKSSLRANDFIARYGGDEFCLVLDISNKTDLEKAISRIKSLVETNNMSCDNPYIIEFSMGYDVYDRHRDMNAEKFLKRLDMLMYANKQAIKEKVR